MANTHFSDVAAKTSEGPGSQFVIGFEPAQRQPWYAGVLDKGNTFVALAGPAAERNQYALVTATDLASLLEACKTAEESGVLPPQGAEEIQKLSQGRKTQEFLRESSVFATQNHQARFPVVSDSEALAPSA
jgi:hypothetical protein